MKPIVRDLKEIADYIARWGKVANIRLIARNTPIPSFSLDNGYVQMVVLAAETWTVYLTSDGYQVFGDMDEFDSDFILAKLSIP